MSNTLPKRPFIVAVDFDGTIVEHHPDGFPRIGKPVPGALETLRELHERGAMLILWTMRSGDALAAACNFLLDHRARFAHVNHNPEQESWSQSPKVYAHAYVDDNACGCPLIPSTTTPRPMVDWSVVRTKLLAELEGRHT